MRFRHIIMKMITTEYKIYSPRLPIAFDGFVIAHVSDLHNREFGHELIERVDKVKPDAIAITGDMIHRENESAAAEKFALGAVQIAPVYYVPGNHEKVLKCYPEFADKLKDMGVNVLNNEYAAIEKDGEKIAMLGMNDPTFFENGKAEFIERLNALQSEIKENEIEYTVLLSHRPEMFARYVDAGVDLSLTGHAHGGHVRFPLIGAVYAPNQGLFPKYSEGRHSKDGKTMIISKGLGKSSWIPRIFNPPELAVEILCRVEPEKSSDEREEITAEIVQSNN